MINSTNDPRVKANEGDENAWHDWLKYEREHQHEWGTPEEDDPSSR